MKTVETLREQFRKEHPETIGEKDKEFDNANYVEWLENKLTIPSPTNRTFEARPEIICMCGSTRYADFMAAISWEMEKLGKIVLRVNYVPDWYVQGEGLKENGHIADQQGLKEKLDTLHFRKIEMADRVFVCDYAGYIGESTRNEINHAEKVGKPILYSTQETEFSEIVARLTKHAVFYSTSGSVVSDTNKGVTEEKWISIKDRQPETYTTAYCCDEDYDPAIAIYAGDNNWQGKDGRPITILYWLNEPLPSPPKSQGHE